MTTEDKYHGF